MGTGLSAIDVAVVVLVMAAVTWLGHRLSGRVATRTAFFQGEGSLPWWAVSASIIATLVSAVTFISVPANVFAPGGDLKYFQVILGLALGKVAVGMLLAKPFHASTGLRSSYEYIGARLDRRDETQGAQTGRGCRHPRGASASGRPAIPVGP